MQPQQLLSAKYDILVVDADARVGDFVRDESRDFAAVVRTAMSVEQALLEVKRKEADVVFVNLQINDNSGVGLIRRMRETYPRMEVIAMSRLKQSDALLEAWRAGASDMMAGPLKSSEVRRSIDAVAQRRAHLERLVYRNQRLRQVCRQMNKARHEISQQVDLLCNDLVRAYQDIAQQLNVTQISTEYAQYVSNELEVEGLLRKTMEWILKKVGPINAAVFLPDADRQFALGAYLNLDTEADAPLIHQMAGTLVQHANDSTEASLIDNDEMIEDLFGRGGEALKGRTWLSVSCPMDKESLAVLVLFRRQVEGIDATTRATVEAISPLLAAKMEEALSLFQRMNEGEDIEESEESDEDLFGN